MKAEDIIGRVLLASTMFALVVINGSFLYVQGLALSVACLASLLSIAFSLMMIFFTIIRLPPKSLARGVQPRISAIVGTYLVLFLVILPAPTLPRWLEVVALGLTTFGFALSIYCLAWLGRSFSIMASARGLVVDGPYAIVRHPLYLAEWAFVAGNLIIHFSATACILVAVQVAFQFQRMRNEEAVLRGTFDGYEQYARSVPMLVPRLFAAQPITRS